jgi:hypothetical protein
MLKQNSYNMLELDNIGDSFNKFSKDWIKKWLEEKLYI